MTTEFNNEPPFEVDILQAMRDINALEVLPPSLYTLTLPPNQWSYGAPGSARIGTDISNGVFANSGPPISSMSKYNNIGTLQWAVSPNNNVFGNDSDSIGHVYLSAGALAPAHDVFKYDTNGNLLTSWRAAVGATDLAEDIAVDSNNDIYILITSTKAVRVFDLSGVFQRTWIDSSLGGAPTDLAIDSSDNIYIVDKSNDRIKVYNSNGVFQRQWGSSGTGDGQFTVAQGIAVDIYDDIYVCDLNGANSRIQRFDSSGTFIAKFAVGGIGSADNVRDIEFDLSNIMYLADSTITGVLKQKDGQTRFKVYTASSSVSLGIPDKGVNIPPLDGLTDNNAIVDVRHFTDMRTAIETLAPLFKNPVTNNPYVAPGGGASADNLITVAVSPVDYFDVDVFPNDWQDDPLTADPDEDLINEGEGWRARQLGEIRDCITQLEASVLI